MGAIVSQVNISSGGMPKLAVPEAHVTIRGLAGDGQRNGKFRGGPDRAICIYGEELYKWLRDTGVNVTSGQIGENITTRGLELGDLHPGDKLRIGAATIQITKVRVPCNQLKKWDLDLPELIIGRSGWMARVIEEGIVRPGDAVQRVE